MRNINVPGPLIMVVGPSGVGKDSLLGGARARLAHDGRFIFPRRCITRPSDHGGEDHLPMTMAEFDRRRRDGAFLAHWRAHGFGYGIPVGILEELRRGKAAVINGSRGVVEDVRRRLHPFHVIHVTAAPATVAERLAHRRRETSAQITQRLNRIAPPRPKGDPVFHNDRPLNQSIAAFTALLERLYGDATGGVGAADLDLWQNA